MWKHTVPALNLDRNFEIKKGKNMDGKSSDSKLVFSKINSSKAYIGNLINWTFVLFLKGC